MESSWNKHYKWLFGVAGMFYTLSKCANIDYWPPTLLWKISHHFQQTHRTSPCSPIPSLPTIHKDAQQVAWANHSNVKAKVTLCMVVVGSGIPLECPDLWSYGIFTLQAWVVLGVNEGKICPDSWRINHFELFFLQIWTLEIDIDLLILDSYLQNVSKNILINAF